MKGQDGIRTIKRKEAGEDKREHSFDAQKIFRKKTSHFMGKCEMSETR